jgi:hypothetical protein
VPRRGADTDADSAPTERPRHPSNCDQKSHVTLSTAPSVTLGSPKDHSLSHSIDTPIDTPTYRNWAFSLTPCRASRDARRRYIRPHPLFNGVAA